MYFVDTYIHSGLFYDEVNCQKNDDIIFYLNECRKIRGTICDVCCGTGRVTIPLAQNGINIKGFDQSPSMIDEAKEKSIDANINVDLKVADLLNYSCKEKFDGVICTFNSLQYFYTNEEIGCAFTNIKKLLYEDGYFIFDVFNPSIKKMANINEALHKQYVRQDGTKVSIYERNEYFADNQVLRTIWTIKENDKQIRECILDARCFFPKEIEVILRYYGFIIISKWGDFNYSEFSSNSSKQVIVARKIG